MSPPFAFAFSFSDEFSDPISLQDIFTGDEGIWRDRIGGSGDAGGPQDIRWRAWLQNWWNRGGYNPCSDSEVNKGQCPERYGTNPGNSRVEIGDGALQMFRSGDFCTKRAHRFVKVRSAGPFVASSNFAFEIRPRLIDPQGWGVGWSVENLVSGWYIRDVEDFHVVFAGIDREWRTPANDQQWHTFLVKSVGSRRDGWIDGNWFGGGNSTASPTGYVWFGNSSTQYEGWQVECSLNDGMGPWPNLQIDYIRFNFGPSNGSPFPASGCSGAGTTVRFATTYTDPDGAGDIREAHFLLNSALEGNNSAFYGRYSVQENRFYLYRSDQTGSCADVGGGWMNCPNAETNYAKLKSSSYATQSGNTLTVYWDSEFKPGWTENVNEYLFARDSAGLESGWEDKGDYGVDTSAPSIPSLNSPPNGSVVSTTQPTLVINSISDVGCANNVRYEITADDDANFGSPNWDSGWISQTNFSGSPLVPATYWWRARAQDRVGNTSSWSSQWSFTINRSPTASFSCSSTSFGSQCREFAGLPLTFVNNSQDPDNNISTSSWVISSSAGNVVGTHSCSGICNYTPTLPPDAYNAFLTMTDAFDLASSASRSFQILRDASAGFMCSRNNTTFQPCEDVRLSKGERLYFKDDPPLQEHSTPSDGASITNRTWKWEGTTFESNNNANPSLVLPRSGTISITLEIRDSNARSASKSHVINVRLGLPRFLEFLPF